jgi:hypothetical protein
MKYLLIIALLVSSQAFANCQFNFTYEQEFIINSAYDAGYPEDLGYALAAISWKESFVGRHVVRINPRDGKHGSYGVTHVQLTTAMELLNIDSYWRALDKLPIRMMSDDRLMYELSLMYLMKFEYLGYRGMIAKYNGSGARADQYANDVIDKVNKLMRCNYF